MLTLQSGNEYQQDQRSMTLKRCRHWKHMILQLL